MAKNLRLIIGLKFKIGNIDGSRGLSNHTVLILSELALRKRRLDWPKNIEA